MATGNYTGNGAATQAIAGAGFQPEFVIVYKTSTAQHDHDWALKSNLDGLNASVWYAGDNTRYEADQVISLDVDGFTVGDGTISTNICNVNLMTYTFIAFRRG